MKAEEAENNSGTPVRWEPQTALRNHDSRAVNYSRGFLRCRPEKWFPGFAASWLPISHALGVELRVTEVQPQLQVPQGVDYGYAGTLNREYVGILMAESTAMQLAEVLVPSSPGIAQNLILEYLARRALGSLNSAWSGPEVSKFVFDRNIDPFAIQAEAYIKCSFFVNNMQFAFWVALGQGLVNTLDGLWRRQLRSSSKTSLASLDLVLEVATLAVPPSMLADYTNPGTMIDLEVPAGDSITLRSRGKSWLPAKLCSVDGKFAIEILPGAANNPSLPQGHTRLAIELGRLELDPFSVIEISQIGAIYSTNLDLTSTVNLMVNDERIAEATLCVYEGRFAISVV